MYDTPQINVQTNLYRKWNLKDNQTVTTIHAPLQEIKINTTKGDIIASPLKKKKEK